MYTIVPSGAPFTTDCILRLRLTSSSQGVVHGLGGDVLLAIKRLTRLTLSGKGIEFTCGGEHSLPGEPRRPTRLRRTRSGVM